MTPRTQKRILDNQPYVITIKDAIQVLNDKKMILLDRRIKETDKKLDHEIFKVEADRCNKILKEIA